ncbi:uncharacterized protein LOC106131024 [Amyelois transitella]|uniref:uncharacterized protein LOC106131024 n=1 Tax=Amyelois transitella TaxID=680683 RepID=UPI00067D2D55|nr:uncharacterized protein LOC106131024 [Amyelois transitella]XP_060808950.1 uncharacterized protein LOC106131024 [Amyelois transitella]
MISQTQNRVQAIKSKFENLNIESEPIVFRKKTVEHLYKRNEFDNFNKENELSDKVKVESDSTSSDECVANVSYLYGESISDVKISLSRQSSDPGKKLHRSHAFRCDRSQKVLGSPKRHGSCYGRSETSDFSLKMGEKRLSKERLKKLGNLLEDQMKKENFKVSDRVAAEEVKENVIKDSIPDSEVPPHILEQYAQVIKPKRKEERQDAMTDSGVSSETENLEEDRGRTKKLVTQFEKPESEVPSETNLESMNDLAISSETMRLERKNPHLILTDTLKKALKQPLPAGPPPKKPPRTFATSPIPENKESERKNAKKMLEKLEQVLQKREASKNVYDIAEADMSLKKPKPKEIHYLCTEILDITQRTLLPNQNKDFNCFKLNCSNLRNSTASLPYTRMSSHESYRDDDKVFNDNDKCMKCQLNDKMNDSFKCHLTCECKKSEFYVENEHIYDEPCTDGVPKKNKYGTLNLSKSLSKSLEDLRNSKSLEQHQKIYDIPCEEEAVGKPKTDFEKLRSNFENITRDGAVYKKEIIDRPKHESEISKLVLGKLEVTEKPVIAEKPEITEKPPINPKPVLIKFSRSSENLAEEDKSPRYSTEKRFKKNESRTSLPRTRDTQVDIDRENLNRLMNEIYETVTAACNMADNKPGCFPTDADASTSEESVKITRSLTEKRKNYVRRVSSRVAYLDQRNIKNKYRHQTSICSYKSEIIDNPYSTFRSWKSFRTSQNNLNRDKMESADSKINLTDDSGNALSMDCSDGSIDNLSIDGKTGCVEIPMEAKDKLFNICLLVGLNYMSGKAYVKNVFPSQVAVPPHIENLIFPETLSWSQRGQWTPDASSQCYSLVLTTERGERAYGYCRRVLPEGATTCLPLCYCIIGKYRAPGFYYKILQEIESHHGSSDQEIQSLLHQLFDATFPRPGEEIVINTHTDKQMDHLKCKTLPDLRRSPGRSGDDHEESPRFLDFENNNGPKRFTLSFETRQKVMKRPMEPRVDEDNLSTLIDSFGTGLAVKVFGSLLLERKVIVISDKLSQLSSCMEALQSILYPFVWQQPLISAIPSEIQRDVLQAPLPILAGMLSTGIETDEDLSFEEGMLIDLTHPSKVLFYQGDEATILPTSCYKTLKTSLQMELVKHKDTIEDAKTRNVLISEAFLRFFVEVLGDFWRYFSVGEVAEGMLGKDGVVFDKESFKKNATPKQNQYFLEWFTETAMFNHFVQNMAACYHPDEKTKTIDHTDVELVDTPLPDFYRLFEERVRCRQKLDVKNYEKSYKSAVNKRVKLLKNKLKDLIT